MIPWSTNTDLSIHQSNILMHWSFLILILSFILYVSIVLTEIDSWLVFDPIKHVHFILLFNWFLFNFSAVNCKFFGYLVLVSVVSEMLIGLLLLLYCSIIFQYKTIMKYFDMPLCVFYCLRMDDRMPTLWFMGVLNILLLHLISLKHLSFCCWYAIIQMAFISLSFFSTILCKILCCKSLSKIHVFD